VSAGCGSDVLEAVVSQEHFLMFSQRNLDKECVYVWLPRHIGCDRKNEREENV